MTTTIELPLNSMWKDTEVITNSDNNMYFGMWIRPLEIADMLDDAEERQVVYSDIGRLDRIAHEKYGDVGLWWIVAVVNNIVDPVAGMSVGDTLLIPARSRVLALKQRGTRRP